MKLRNTHVTPVLLVVWSIFFTYLWQTVFFIDEHGIRTTSSKLWADWVVHLTFTHVFAEWPTDDWFYTNPLYALEAFRYPFLANLPSGLLLKSGMSLESSMVLPSILSSILLVAGLMFFYRVAGFSPGWSGVGIALFLFNGGMGFIAWVLGVSTTPTHIPELGVIIQNFVTSEFIPQRPMLFGAFLFLVLVSALFLVSQAPISQRSHMIMIGTGIGAAVLMLSHAHSFLTFVMICAVFAVLYWRAWRVWLTLLGSAAIACGSVYALYYASTDVEGYFAWEPLALINSSKTGFWQFVILNYGLFLPLVLLAAFRTPAAKNPLFIAGAVVFVLGYLVRFQPWIWDNTKILTWGYLLLSVAVLQYFVKLWRTSTYYKPLVAVLVLLLCASGAIEVFNVIKPRANVHTVFSAEDMDIATEFNALSTHRDLVLTAMPNHNNWVHALAARPVFMAYTGWLWSYGLDTKPGETLMQRMLDGDYQLVVDNGIRYIVIDRRSFNKDLPDDFARKLKLVIQTRRYRVYAVPG